MLVLLVILNCLTSKNPGFQVSTMTGPRHYGNLKESGEPWSKTVSRSGRHWTDDNEDESTEELAKEYH